MNELTDKIEELEIIVLRAVDTIRRAKSEKGILLEENQRLKQELNQLREKSSGDSFTSIVDGSHGAEVVGVERDKKIRLIKQELDTCISELEDCITNLPIEG
ncbi:MAG: hypothetical protein AAFQ02_09880 [Bacteroidota bacterium]